MSSISNLIQTQHALLLEVDALNLVERKSGSIKSKITTVLQGLHQLQPAPVAPVTAEGKKPTAKKKKETKK